MEFIAHLLASGVGNLAAYLAAHVLLCLLPAFFIAGAMVALIPRASITRWLGRNTPGYISYPAAAAAGSLIAVCSCTIVPLFAGVYRKGAGIGPAITFLFFAPAGNILALAYTGSVLGPEFAAARFLLCLVFGIGIGLLMAMIFARDDARHDQQTDAMFAEQAAIGGAASGVLLALVALLIAGTLKVQLLAQVLLDFTLPLAFAEAWQAQLFAWVPFDAARGEEGVSLQGSLLIGLLVAIGFAAWRGMENIVEGANRWTWAALALTAGTLLFATLKLTPTADGLRVAVTGRVVAEALAMVAVWHFARQLAADDWRAWLWEAWRFVKQIFVLLVVGVFIVGVARALIQPEWIGTGGRERPEGQCDRGGLRRVHVLPHAGGGAGGAHVPRSRHAPRPAAGLPDGGPGTEPAEHTDDGGRHRPPQGAHLRGLGGGVQRGVGLAVRCLGRCRRVFALVSD